MMKQLVKICLLLLLPVFVIGQTKREIDSLKHELAIAKDDTSRVLILSDLSFMCLYLDNVSFGKYSQEGLDLAQKIHFSRGEIRMQNQICGDLQTQGEIPKSFEILFKELQIAEEKHYFFEKAMTLNCIGNGYYFLSDFSKALIFYRRANQAIEGTQNKPEVTELKKFLKLQIGQAYNEMNQLDSAFYYLQESYRESLNSEFWHPVSLYLLSDCLFKRGDHKKALEYMHQSLELTDKSGDRFTNAEACSYISRFFKELSQPDSAIYYAKKGLATSNAIDYKIGIIKMSKLLAEQYLPRDTKVANAYLQLAMSTNDEIFGAKKVQDLQKALSEEQERQRIIEAQRIAKENRLKLYALIMGLSILVLVAFFLYRNNQKEKKAKNLLQEQKEKVENTLFQLKATQTQLIQSEKLASLGELTAGIAHEIQNPLNFVNNFSELSVELIDELKSPLTPKGGTLEAELLSDISQNLEKINHHGKRASNIVKGMLEHSRASTGVKELTDINKLADEYLRLAYHGLRAKDNSFNADYELIIDENLPKTEVIPQDIGRVLLNLINNAFYAVAPQPPKGEQEVSALSRLNDESYIPIVTVSTRYQAPPLGAGGAGTEGAIIIKVKDNGIGMPESVRAKVFQPFFTTKPTGQGTGIGLSLAYDIVTKGHGGTLEVVSTEGVGTEFIISLPFKPH